MASRGRSGWRTPRAVAAAGGLLALYYVMAVSAVSQKSMTFDEMAHLTGGYTYWAFNDYRLHPENGNWPQRLAALPAAVSGVSFPSLDQPAWRSSNVYAIGDQFLHFSGNDAAWLLGRGRAVMALLGVALGALVYVWARRLISPAGAWVSLVLFVFSPTFLAHGPLATSDMAAALFFTSGTGAAWVAFHRVTIATVLGAAVLIAGAFLAKLSAPILVPVLLLMLVVRVVDGRPLAIGFRRRAFEVSTRSWQLALLAGVAVVFGAVVWSVVWASYGFRYSAFGATATGGETFLGQVSQQAGVVGWLLSFARTWHLLPEAYIYGSGLTVQFAAERAAFLNGEFSTTGWWWYFPYAFAVKTTIPALALCLLSLAALVVRLRRGPGEPSGQDARVSVYAATPLLALIFVYGAFALASSLNIGQRHLLPIYPALFILAGGAAFWIRPLSGQTRPTQPRPRTAGSRARPRSRQPVRSATRVPLRALAPATIALLVWHVAESLRISPSYLAYFNQFAGGPSEGYKHLADSSLDWGQDLPALARWLDTQGLQRPGGPAVYLSYFGTARPEYYGIRATRLAGFIDRRPPQPPVPLGGGVYCVSATMLNVIGRVFYRAEDEQTYRTALQNLAAFAGASKDERTWEALMQQTGENYWHQLFADFDRMRTGRLLAYLRNRQPDALVGYTILIYRLGDREVSQAIDGPLPDSPG